MLQGPSYQPRLPRAPSKDEGLDALYEYIKDLEQSLYSIVSNVVVDTVGLLGVRGLSSTGLGAKNFTRFALPIGGGTTAQWIFSNIEQNASYLVLTAPHASVLITTVARETTRILFTFSPTILTGTTLDLMILR